MDRIVKNKINKILDKEENNGKEKLSSKQLGDFEKKYNISLPREYKEFLTTFYSCYVNDDYYFPMIEKSIHTADDGMETIDYFYNLQFESGANDFINNYGNRVLPIGESSGDYICIGVQEDNFGKIFCLYHEDEMREDGLYLIANSFNEFILSFKYVESDDENIHIAFSPELDNFFRKAAEKIKKEDNE